MRIFFILQYNSLDSNNWRGVQAQEQSRTGMGGGKEDVCLSHDWLLKNQKACLNHCLNMPGFGFLWEVHVGAGPEAQGVNKIVPRNNNQLSQMRSPMCSCV